MNEEESKAFSDLKQKVTDIQLQLQRHKHLGAIDATTVLDNLIESLVTGANGKVTGDITLTAGSNVTITQSGKTFTFATVAGLLSAGLFGNGSDGAGVADGSGTLAGLSPSSSIYTLTRDVYFTDLTISTGVTIKANGYQIFVSGTLTINGTGTIQNNGGDGSAGVTGSGSSGGAGGGGGTLAPGGTLPAGIAGIAGGTGGNANANNIGNPGTDGGNGVSANPSIGVSGSVGTSNTGNFGGQANGKQGGAGGAGGTAGTATLALYPPDTLLGCYIHADLVATYLQHKGTASSGGAGGGGAGGGGAPGVAGGGGGGAGGGGAPGGIVAVYAKIIVNASTGGIKANGGAGGNGGNGGISSGSNYGGGGGGAGGRGGNGGAVIVVYETLTQTGSFLASGGSGSTHGSGSAGNIGANGNDGTDGGAGISGTVWQYQIS